MEVVFDTKPLAAAKRRQAWRDAICEIYLQVDCAAEQDSEYAGFVREARFGDVTLTDTLLSPAVDPAPKPPSRPRRQGLLLRRDRTNG